VQGESDYRKTTYVYSEAGRRSEKIDRLGKSETYVYDGAGLLTSCTKRDNHTWKYEYDQWRRGLDTALARACLAYPDYNRLATRKFIIICRVVCFYRRLSMVQSLNTGR
jgi:YD repeat-containing protein